MSARTTTIEEIKGIVIKAINGVPLRVGEVADVTIGHEVRRGAVTADRQGEVVLGLGFMLMGENSHEVTWSMKYKVDDIKKTQPANVSVTPVYDRTELVAFVFDTVRKNLFEGGLFVVAVLFLFLENLRAAAIVALAIPLSLLFEFCGMLKFGISASLLSLGAIDFGMVVDSSVVMVENCIRHIAHGDNKRRPLLDVIRDAAIEVRRPTMFGDLGSEFVPRLSEGALVLGLVRLPGTDLAELVRGNTAIEKLLLEKFPDEVAHVWNCIGTAEVATDPMGIELTDEFISLKPRSPWKQATTQDEVTALIESHVRTFPGIQYELLQPIEHRVNEMISGSRSQFAMQLFGDEFPVLQQKGAEIAVALRQVRGNADVYSSSLAAQPVLQIKVRQEELARYGVQAEQVLEMIESIGSLPLSEIVQEQLRFPLVIRLLDQHRTSPEAIGAIQLRTATGERLPLSRLASIDIVESPSTIRREWGQRCLNITCNVRGRDLGSFVADAQRLIAEQVKLPAGRYRIEYSGQFENMGDWCKEHDRPDSQCFVCHPESRPSSLPSTASSRRSSSAAKSQK